MDERTSTSASSLTFVRGSLLGLVLGDAVGAVKGEVPPAGQLRARTGGQLACFTTEGLIRADVRSWHKGICHPPGVVWHAYRRWAALQGLIARAEEECGAMSGWPDGWLARVPVLKEQRGTAPATVKALTSNTQGTVREPVGTSIGAHACTRALPVGLFSAPDVAADLAAEIAALTHRGEAVVAAAIGAVTVRMLGEGRELPEAVGIARRLSAGGVAAGDLPILDKVMTAVGEKPADGARLRTFAPDATAVSALAGGVYAAASFTGRGDVREALRFAATAGDGGHVATVTGALLGAMRGPDALPTDWLSRAELVWIADTLARDVVAELAHHPSGSGWGDETDPYWWDRYPGW